MRVVVVGLEFGAEFVPIHAGAGHRSFVSSVLAGRAPFADDVTAANWTATGIAAHESARRGGQRVAVPDFD
jgi:hypothetical protein